VRLLQEDRQILSAVIAKPLAELNRRFDSGPPSPRDSLFGSPSDNHLHNLWDQKKHDRATKVLAHGFHVS